MNLFYLLQLLQSLLSFFLLNARRLQMTTLSFVPYNVYCWYSVMEYMSAKPCILWHIDPLLLNDPINTFPQGQILGQQSVARERLSKHVLATTNTLQWRTPVAGQRMCFLLCGPTRESIWHTNNSGQFNSSQTCVEAGSNTFTVILQVAGGKENGSLQSDRVKCGHESHRTRTRKWLRWRDQEQL
jgi:hypothetical protein